MLIMCNIVDAVLYVLVPIIFYNGIYLNFKNNKNICLTQLYCVVIKYINYYC